MEAWGRYRDFLAIAEAGSLSAAARACGLSQPTMTRRLARLEADLGTRLMIRHPEGLALTEAGEKLARVARRMRDELARAEAEISGRNEALCGKVRVTATETLGIVWLSGVVDRFHRRHPDIRLDIVIDNNLTNLLSRDADIAIRLLRPVQPDLITKKLGEVSIGLYATKAYIRRHGLLRRPEEIGGHRVIGLLGRTPTARMTEALFAPEAHVMRSNSMLSIHHAVRAGLGIGPVLDLLAQEDHALVRCLPGHAQLDKEVWLSTVPELRDTQRIRVVYDFLSEAFRSRALMPLAPDPR